MLLTISTTHQPATDLGYLLFKHPDRVSEFPQSFGDAWVFFPEASEERCTAALLLDIDAVKLAAASGKRGGAAASDASLARYVNDRPYAASSLMGVALARVFSTARSGRADSAHQWLADQVIPLEIGIPALPCHGGLPRLKAIFEPLGWEVDAKPIPLDERFPEWGNSIYVNLALRGELRLADALNQLHVLLPVFDESKHYWQGDAEIDKLLKSGQGWLATHPHRELITRKYLAKSKDLQRAALSRLTELDDEANDDLVNDDADVALIEREREAKLAPASDEPDSEVPTKDSAEAGPGAVVAEVPEPVEPLRVLRQQAVMEVLQKSGVQTVLDLGCGQGALLTKLVKNPQFKKIVGTDVSIRSLQIAADRLHLDSASERQLDRVQLYQSSLTYEDERLTGFDAAVLMEVIEHIDIERLPALEHALFGAAKPGIVIVTTPNSEYNPVYGLTESDSSMRHTDHRFEWNRQQFDEWAGQVAATYGYLVQFQGVGLANLAYGSPTQMAIFELDTTSDAGGE